MASLSNWSPYDDYVQSGLTDGRFQNAAYTLVAAGPPRLSQVGGPAALAASLSTGSTTQDQIAYPVGLVQNVAIGHNMNLSRIFELGSVRSYFIPGRVVGQISLSRVMYHGPSLLRALYAYYQDLVSPTLVEAAFDNLGAANPINAHNVIIPPGYENFYINLLSDLFTQPIGLLLLFKDSNEDTIGAVYAEACYVPNHNLATDAMGTIIQETAAIQFERLIPIATSVVGLISSADYVNPII